MRDNGGANEWGQARRIEPGSTVREFDHLGTAVSVYSNYMIVGAPGNDGASGLVYNEGLAAIYQRPSAASTTWTLLTYLRPSDGNTNDNFGSGVAMYGEVAVVGSPKHDHAASDAGAIYVFLRNQGGSNNWGQAGELTASDAKPGARYGSCLSFDQDFLIVGAPYDSTQGTNAGAAYLIPFAGGETKLLPSGGSSNEYFGYAVDTHGDYAVVGAFGDDEDGALSGAAYVYGLNWGGVSNWGQVVKLTASDSVTGLTFGTAVAVAGDNIVVGAAGDDSGGMNAGALYVFYRNEGGSNNWGQIEKLIAQDASADSVLGSSLAMDDTTFVAGAIGESSGAMTNGGAAYVFDQVLADILLMRRSGTNTDLRVAASEGRTYRFQSSEDFASWSTFGSPFTPSNRYSIQTLPAVPDSSATVRIFRFVYSRP